MEGLLIRGGRGKGRGRVPPVITVYPGSRGARIVTEQKVRLNMTSSVLQSATSLWELVYLVAFDVEYMLLAYWLDRKFQ